MTAAPDWSNFGQPGVPLDSLGKAFDRAVGLVEDSMKTLHGKSWGGGLSKADKGATFTAPNPVGHSVLIDPNLWQSNAEFRQRPSSLGWGTLRRMAKTPLISSIIQVRLAQIAEFCKPQDNPYLPGFKIALRHGRKNPTRTELRMMEDLSAWLMQCGVVTDQRQTITRPGFSTFAKAIMRDSLTYDQACAEIVPGRGARLARDGKSTPARIQWVDASTIRISQAAMDAYGLPEDDFTTPRHVQVIEEVVVAEYEPARMLFGVRNPSTSINQHGYGISEQEMMVRIITAWLNVFDRNSRYFTQGFTGRGFLNFKTGTDQPALTEAQMRMIKRELMLLGTGATGSHRLAAMNTAGAEFINVGNDVQDAQWMGFSDQAVKLACALHLMEPTEINHIFGNSGQASAMGNANSAERVETSRARGLVPLVGNFFDWINRWVIWQIDSDFKLVATGTQHRDEAEQLALDKDRVTTYMHINEVRALRDLPPDPHGDVVLNPAYLQAMQMSGDDDSDETPAEAMDIASLFESPMAEDTAEDGGDSGQGAPKLVDDQQRLSASRRGHLRTTTINL